MAPHRALTGLLLVVGTTNRPVLQNNESLEQRHPNIDNCRPERYSKAWRNVW